MQGRHAETRRWAKTHGSRPGPSPVDASFAIHGFNLPLAVLSHMLAIGQHASCSFSVTSVCASVLESPTLKCPPMTPPSASPHSFDKLALSPATLWRCHHCNAAFLRYTEYGGYYQDDRIRP